MQPAKIVLYLWHIYQLLHMPKLYMNTIFKYFNLKPALLVIMFFLGITANAQCPPNIDFEMGDFTGWQCLTGSVNNGVITVSPTAPIPGRHDIISAASLPVRDPYGNFPTLCPNGSNYSVRIGLQTTGTNADGVSYTFTIPAGQNKFRLIYNYAIVINNGGGHPALQQPRLRVTVNNLTDNTTNTGCDSADIAYSTANPLPGFLPPPTVASQFRWKPWAARSINLDGNAGKTIQITFIATGCGLFPNGSHFGYAYLDVGSICNSNFDGAVFCPDDTAVTVSAPPGYQAYNWYNGLGTVLLGTGQSLTIIPPPLSGDSVKVELVPFNGYGCLDTLTAYLWDTLTVRAYAGADKETCDNNPVQLGGPPEPNRVYKWFPATGLSNPDIANPIATPSATTTYTLTVTNINGGCITTDEATVSVDVLSDSIQQIGPSSYCTSSGQTVRLKVLPHDSIQWYKDGFAIIGATATDYLVTQTGAYHAVLFSSAGCTRTTVVKQIDIWESPVAGFNTAPAVQCFNNHQFVFNNTSVLNTGTLQYAWDLGDGTTASTRDVTYSYAKDGVYNVKLLVTAPGGCVDSANKTVQVNPSPFAAFTIDQPQQCFKNNWFVFNTKSTVPSGVLTYTWDFGDGSFNNSNDIAHSYSVPGTYSVKLTAKENNGGCSDDSTMQVVVNPSPIADFTANNYTQCFPGHNFILQNNSTVFSGSLTHYWTFGDGLSDTATNPSHIYKTYGPYTIKLVTDYGGLCKDSISKNVEIYPVPAADFSVQSSVCQDLRVPIINRTTNISNSTVNYFWDFGNGHLDNAYTPVYTYTTAGNYTITLKVSTAQCPVSFNTISKTVSIEPKIAGITYPDKTAFYNYALQLQARNIGNNVTWDPPVNLSSRFSYSPVFKGIQPQLYTIQLKTAANCITVDTQFVKTQKKIDIYVPNGFTPGNDNLNERLRPVLVGFVKVNYFRIYDRWGKLLFSMNSDQPGWDGKLNGNPVNMQTVVWMIEAVDVDGKVHNKQGTTVVIR